MRYNLFIGRYQSPHKGHMHIFDTFLKEDKPVLIAIRDIEPDAANPLNAAEVKALYDGNPNQTITISSNTTTPCGGDKITFTANGAINTAKYQWNIDGLNQGTNSKTFNFTSTKKTGDYIVKVSVEVTAILKS